MAPEPADPRHSSPTDPPLPTPHDTDRLAAWSTAWSTQVSTQSPFGEQGGRAYLASEEWKTVVDTTVTTVRGACTRSWSGPPISP